MTQKLAQKFAKPIADREYDDLRVKIMALFQEKIDTHSIALLQGKAQDFTDYKRRTATVQTWQDAYETFESALRQFVTGDFDD